MGEVYLRLGEVLPTGARAELPFAADAKRVSTWVEALPRADVGATRRALLQALEALSTTSVLKGATRREMADVLQPIVLDTALSTKRLYAGKPLPLTNDLAALPKEAVLLHLRLAHAYRMGAADLCAPSGSLPWLRGGKVAETLHLAVHHYAEALLATWRMYVDLPADAWRGLHRAYRFAVSRELEQRPMPNSSSGAGATLQRRYLQLLLMDVIHPRAFSQSEQDAVWMLCEAFVDRTPLRDTPSDTSVGVADDADEGPSVKLPARQYLDLVAFATAVEGAIITAESDPTNATSMLGLPVALSADVLRKLRRALSQAAARQFLRLEAGHSVETVFGLSGLHFQTSGERDFDAFARQVFGKEIDETRRATWAVGGVDGAARSARVLATIVDQSLGGYRIRWPQATSQRLRVGELVGLHLGDSETPSDWMIGVLRWLRYEADGQVMAGVELLSRSVAAVALLTMGGSVRMPLRALELRPPYGGDDWLYLAGQRLPQGEVLRLGRECDVADRLLDRRPEDRLRDLRLTQVLGDYFLYRYAPVPVPLT